MGAMASTKDTTPVVTNATAETEKLQRCRARSALDDLKAKVKDYDEQYKASETASGHLSGVIAKAQSAFDELATTASTLKDKTVEIPTKALSRTIAAANSSLEKISEVAATYDDKFKLSSTVQKAVSIPRTAASSALTEVANRSAALSASAHAQLQGVNDGICSRAVEIATGGAGMIFSTAAALEDRYSIEEKATNAGTKAKDKALEIDEKYNVKEKAGALATGVLTRAEAIDSKVTGGKLTGVALTAYEKGLELAWGGLAYAQGGYEAAKQQRAGAASPEPTDGKEAAEATAAAPVAPVAPAAPPTAPAAPAAAAEPSNEVADASNEA